MNQFDNYATDMAQQQIVASALTPYGMLGQRASVNFNRFDGEATISINLSLSEEAAKRVEAVLREVAIEERARQEEEQRKLVEIKRAEMERYRQAVGNG